MNNDIEQFEFLFFSQLSKAAPKSSVERGDSHIFEDDGVNYEEAEVITPPTMVIEETSLQNEIV